MIKEFLEAGRIVGTHGLRGELRVDAWCDEPAFLKNFKTLYFDNRGEKPVEVVSCRPHSNVALLCLEGISSVEAAQSLRGRLLFIKRADAKLEEGRHFIAELIDCEVWDADDSEKKYGTISQVSKTGANDVWHIKLENEKEYLIPVIPEVVIETCVEKNFVKIRPLKGIFEDED